MEVKQKAIYGHNQKSYKMAQPEKKPPAHAQQVYG
jgi:hypothetical protein